MPGVAVPFGAEQGRLRLLPLRRGATGEAVRDVQRRLVELGIGCEPDEPGVYGSGTEASVSAFQQKRGLRADGVCGAQTWGVLVEAGHRPGDRLLYYTTPALRGDDVATLQRTLGALGFDAGRVDGIFGEQTQAALLDFQRNAGLATDAVFGPTSLDVLTRLSSRAHPHPVADVRERETLRRSPPTLAGRRLVVGDLGGLGALVRAVGQRLTGGGATVVTLQHPDPSDQAAQANGIGADLYVGLAAGEGGCRTAYYAAHGFASPGGRRLAECAQAEVEDLLGAPAEAPAGMALPVLRETRMPAIVCELGPPEMVVERGAELARAFHRAVARWARCLEQL